MATTRQIVDYALDDNGREMRDALYSSIYDKVMAHIETKKQEIAQSLITPNEEQDIEQNTNSETEKE